jgi:hypothetical protein
LRHAVLLVKIVSSSEGFNSGGLRVVITPEERK